MFLTFSDGAQLWRQVGGFNSRLSYHMKESKVEFDFTHVSFPSRIYLIAPIVCVN
jgi:hypothetical protein